MTDLTAPAARALMGEWELALTAERKSPAASALYVDAVGRYLAWTETQDQPPKRRTTLQTWITDMLHDGRSPSTARIRPYGGTPPGSPPSGTSSRPRSRA